MTHHMIKSVHTIPPNNLHEGRFFIYVKNLSSLERNELLAFSYSEFELLLNGFPINGETITHANCTCFREFTIIT